MTQLKDEDKNDLIKVTLTITTQQYPLVERVRYEKSMGDTDAEIFRNVFLDWYEKKKHGIKPISITGYSRDNIK